MHRPNDTIIIAAKQNNVQQVKTGDVVSFTYLANQKIQNNSVHRITKIRRDIVWKDVVNSYFKNNVS